MKEKALFPVFLLGLALAVPLTVMVTGDDAARRPGSSEPTALAVELGEMFIRPSSTTVPAGSSLKVTVTNGGQTQHDLAVEGGTKSRLLNPGQSQAISFGSIDESTAFFCSVPGHREAGMEMRVTVAGSAASSSHSAEPSGSGDAASIDFSREPSDGWRPFDPKLPAAPSARTHVIRLVAVEKEIEVAPGVRQMLWTFNGTTPGPVLRGKVGDIFDVTLTNKGTLGHSVDFHASKVAWNDEMRTIAPGESLKYRFQAKHSGIFMYHCGTAPALHHIGNGMFGTIIIDPPGLPKVDHEYVLVQHEIYLGPQDAPGDLAKMQDVAFDAVVFNGYVNQYQHAPIRVEPNQRIRVWVLDAGPSENSAFHIVGTIFDTVYKEGAFLLRPGAARGGAQALDLQPAQGGFVEFSLDERGLYPIVTHKFANVGKGALGLFQAGEVAAVAGGH